MKQSTGKEVIKMFVDLGDGSRHEFVFRCEHPDIENNQCPTGFGDCGECEHCIAYTDPKTMLKLIWGTFPEKDKEDPGYQSF